MTIYPSLFERRQLLLGSIFLVFQVFHSYGIAEDIVRPNILWLSAEDIGPQLACYGDTTATTPTIDGLAQTGLVYDIAWSNYPVCAPARTTIITGMYAGTLGAGNMRSRVPLPDGVKMFPEYLREAGYYCTNNSKEDYNVIKRGKVWDESSRKAHYKHRAAGQPFFAVFNYTGTHESKIRVRPHTQVIDPATVQLPSYWPDTPEVRQDWAQYYDNLQSLDSWVAKKLQELKETGLADNTIVIFFGDHGSGMPRHKRFAGDSGMRIPFVVHVPEQLGKSAPDDYQPGGHSSRPVGFIDLAPTMLSLAGLQPPDFMEGDAFMGKYRAEPPKYLFGYRDRMDERPDLSRSIRDDRFVYVRNYMPHLPAGQFVHYQQQTPTTAIWNKLFVEGRLSEIQSHFWIPHPPEELYDLKADPEETVNLVDQEEFANVLARFRDAHKTRVETSVDIGFLHEGELFNLSKKGSPRQIAGTDEYPLAEIFQIADLAASNSQNLDSLVAATESPNPTVRYWATLGLRIRGKSSVEQQAELLAELLDDSSPAVAIVAAEALITWGDAAQATQGLAVLERFANHEESNSYFAIHALNAIDRLDAKAVPILETVQKLPVDEGLKRGGGYLKRLIPDIMSSY